MKRHDFHHAIRLVSLLAILSLTSGCAYLDYNFRTVEKGEYYRSGQMPSSALAGKIRWYELDTVVCLRGSNPDEGWYRREKAVCESRGVTHIDLDWSMKHLPPPESLIQLLAIIREGTGPILVHCQGGTHRAGVASAVYMLSQGASVEEARRQFGLFFSDAPIGRLLDLYEGSSLSFEEWVTTEYPEAYEQVEHPQSPGA